MMNKAAGDAIVSKYSRKAITIATIGSHSALDVCRGAKDEGLQTVVVCQKGREQTYTKHYKVVVDHPLLVDKFSDVASPTVVAQLQKLNAVFIPNRSFEVYVGDYSRIEAMEIPFFGSRRLLRFEERNESPNQYTLMEKAGIRFPKRFASSDVIDRLVIVKAAESERNFQREFFFASSPVDFERKARQLIDRGLVHGKQLDSAVIEEFVIGAHINFNFFYSPLRRRLELMGTDFRRQTNLDGLLRIPAKEQSEFTVNPSLKEAGHVAATVLESMLEKAFGLGEAFVDACQPYGGIVGPFALQSIITPGPPKEDIVVYDVSLRIPGSPGTMFTPYSYYLHGKPLSVGRRIAMEVREAAETGQLEKVVT
ncbi:MAG: DUF1297 domain-containing protein [Candidatus Aenigmarchaeota archaeon]|nr:DUF1297 domain-containing protein [Candidatus Aenigmarchaeota archaeon]